MAPLLVAAAWVFDSAKDGEGGESVKRNALSMRMIWLKLGLRLGSSTQHDCMMKASSGRYLPEDQASLCCFSDLHQYTVNNLKEKIIILAFIMHKKLFKDLPQSADR
ncbi:hypothetical protein CJ030_MR4G018565 [Morella rubra]|uniref:Uncharacterized protein n=1 Tax=Morella rubra TaxID=262757 RepID=A0A6A1VQ83_9ROSI|nr:hypothetical protein CJ030_MR4G018565 [Morella rubra]